jgi:hypothetical protein
VDYSTSRIILSAEILHAKSIRHKTAYKADNIAQRWGRGDAAVANAARLKG